MPGVFGYKLQTSPTLIVSQTCGAPLILVPLIHDHDIESTSSADSIGGRQECVILEDADNYYVGFNDLNTTLCSQDNEN